MAKKTGLVLTGGGMRGICAQTGALVALAELDLKFDAVIGTSAGAIVGAFYAAGKTPQEIRDYLSGLREDDYLDPVGKWSLAAAAFKKFRGFTGYYRGKALLEVLKKGVAPKTRIEDTEIPLLLTVTNVSRGLPQVKSEGRLAELARASSAVPVGFRAQQVDGEYYVDGGAVNNVPIDEIVERRPELEQILVLTSLTVEAPDPPVDNDFLDRPWTPFRIVRRALDAINAAQRLENLEAGGRGVQVVRIRTNDIDMDEAGRIGECIREAYEDTKRQIADGDVDVSEIPRGGA